MTTIACVIENAATRGSAYWGEHGLSYLIETADGRVLFDTGQTSAVLLHNMALLDVSPRDVDAVVLSHAHNDHTGDCPRCWTRDRECHYTPARILDVRATVARTTAFSTSVCR